MAAGLFYFANHRSSSPNGAYLAGEVFGNVFGTILFSLLIAYIVSFVRRSNRAFNIAVCIMGGLFAFAQLGELSRRQSIDRELDAMSATSQQLMEKTIAGEDVYDAQIEHAGTVAEKVDKLADSARGQEAQLLRVVADLLRQVQEISRPYDAAFRQFDEAGGIDAGTMDSEQSFTMRRKLLDDFAQANEDFENGYITLEKNLVIRLEALGFPKDKISKIVSAWRNKARPDLVKKIRELDRQLIAAMHGVLDVLEENWGHWSVNPDTEVLEFDTPDQVINRYLSFLEEIDHLAQAQTAIQKQILEAVKQTQRSRATGVIILEQPISVI